MSLVYPVFRKVPRLHRGICVTEKIDGTNALVAVLSDEMLSTFTRPNGEPVPAVNVAPGVHVLAGSRTRWIWPEQDNHGFAAWVHDNAHELADLDYGLHYGEWYGRGIQRGYGLPDKRFALFNVDRWAVDRPACCDVVPLLSSDSGESLNFVVAQSLDLLAHHGSRIAPGFMKPEGVVVYHTAANAYFKVLLENDEMPKTLALVERAA